VHLLSLHVDAFSSSLRIGGATLVCAPIPKLLILTARS
jgi:hypothetical protein